MDQYLDIAVDEPRDYEGRLVICDGAEYMIGRWVRQSEDRIVHELTNRRTGLTLHRINILRDQETAAKTSMRLAAKLAHLRDLGISTTPEPLIAQGHGGSFEIEEVARSEQGSMGALYEQALSAAQQGKWRECKALSEQVLGANAVHTSALDLLAWSYAESDDYMEAAKIEAAAIESEPNLQTIRHNLLRFAAASGAVNTFTAEFEELKRKWPADNQLDGLAAQIYLLAGRPGIAAGLRIPDSDSELIEKIREETCRRERARARMEAVREAVLNHRDNNAFNDLKQAYAEYSKDVEIAFNWGHLLLRRGDWRDARDVLSKILQFISSALRTQCWGSVAFANAMGGDYEAAASQLMMISSWLTSPDGIPPTVADLPFWAIWLEDERVVADRSMGRPAFLVNRIINSLKEYETDNAELMSTLHHIRAEYERGLGGADG